MSVSATRVWGLASAGDVSVGSVFEPCDEGHGVSGRAGVVSDALPARDASIEPALARASSCGISHLRVVAFGDVPVLGRSAPGVVVVRHLRDGRLAVDAALVADLSSDLHAPGPRCFESYELLEAEQLLTPDLFADDGNEGMQLIAMFCFIEHQLLDELLGHPALTLRVFCAGGPADHHSVDYPLKWGAR